MFGGKHGETGCGCQDGMKYKTIPQKAQRACGAPIGYPMGRACGAPIGYPVGQAEGIAQACC